MVRTYLLIALIIFLPACSQKATFIEIHDEMQIDADTALPRCEELNDENRKTCYGTYLSIKADKKEPIQESFCDKVPDIKEDCILYAKLSNRPTN